MGISKGTDLAGLVRIIIGYIDQLIPVLIALALVYFFIGVVRYIKNRGDVKYRTAIAWSLVALFVLLSVWGILRILTNSLSNTGSDPWHGLREGDFTAPAVNYPWDGAY